MTELMPQLYHNLMSICSVDYGFYYKDVQLDSTKYRVFNYRLCSYTNFNSLPSALNCRGTMFNINDPNNVQLVSLPPEKFFNYDEGNGCQQHESGQFGDQMKKVDGCLISTFLHFDQNNQPTLRLKSKTSVTSSQASEAMELLTGSFRSEIERLIHLQYTVNMEYTSPSNRIVLFYPRPELTVLSIRSHTTGENLVARHLVSFLREHGFQSILEHIVPFQSISSDVPKEEIINSIRAETEGEGYVIEIIRPDRTFYLVKIKTHKYLQLHQCKSKINLARNLFESIINEQADDLRSLLQNDSVALDTINRMEDQVRPIFNHMVHSIEQYYEQYKHLSRKEYAIQIKSTKSMNIYMALLMNLYLGKVNDYKRFALAHANDIFKIQNFDSVSLKSNTQDDDN